MGSGRSPAPWKVLLTYAVVLLALAALGLWLFWPTLIELIEG